MPPEAPDPPAHGEPARLASRPEPARMVADIAVELPRRAGRRRWLRPLLLLAGPLLVAVAAGYVYLTGGRYVGTENAYVKADMVLVGAEVSGPIVAVEIRENQHVNLGDTLFRVDDRPYRIALREAEAELASVANEIASLKAGYGQKLEERALAQSDLDYARRELARQSELLASNTTSRSKHDAVRHDADVVRLRMKVIDQELAQIRAQLGGDPDIAIAGHARYQKAATDIDRARLDLERTVIRAPLAGIASNTPQAGQQVVGNAPMSGPVMSIVADTGAWIEANFKETDLTNVLPGQTVTVRVDSYPDQRWHGTVQSISQATGAEFSVIPPQNATGNWVKVVQRIPVRVAIADNGSGLALRAGMSTTVEIDTGRSRPLPEFLTAALTWIGGPTARAAAPESAR